MAETIMERPRHDREQTVRLVRRVLVRHGVRADVDQIAVEVADLIRRR